MAINLLPSIIKDIERLQRYEWIFQWLLKNGNFSKQENNSGAQAEIIET